MTAQRAGNLFLLLTLLFFAPGLVPTAGAAVSAGRSPDAPGSSRAAESRLAATPLRGTTIAVDPGHQLGNSRFPIETSQLVAAGGFRKPCNSTGTSTDGGYAEATFNWRIARLVQQRLQTLGARVVLTRSANTTSLWGPCVNQRGRFGERVGARLAVSLHADGAPSHERGFHVIAPTWRDPWTSDIHGRSLRLAKSLRGALDAAGLPRSTYIGGGSALSIRPDLGTLNLSDVPIAMLELGNMRNVSDARRMRSVAGQEQYAVAVVRGIRRWLGR